MPLITEIADAVAATLNAATLSQPVTAERHYQPIFDLPEMMALHVSVVARGVVINQLSRSSSAHDVQIDVAVQKKFDAGDSTELDPLMQLVEEIADLFRFKPLADYPAAMWLKTENVPIYSIEHMDQLRQFTSVLTITFRVIR